MKEHGNIDIFFANTGIEEASKPMAEYQDTIFDKLIAMNLKGVWWGCKHVIPKMEQVCSVMISSSVAALKGVGVYVASKHAVVAIMKVAALKSPAKNMSEYHTPWPCQYQ